MWSHITWYLVALSVLVDGTKVPRQIVYQIRPAPLSAFSSQDGTFLLEDGVTEFQFPSFGLKTVPEIKQVKAPAAPPPPPPIPVVTSLTSASNDSADVDSSAGSSSSSSPSEENSSASTKEEISEVPRFGSSPVRQKILQLQPEQIQQIFQQIQPIQQQVQVQQQQPTSQTIEVGPRYEYKSEEANNNSEDIKTAQTEVITEEKLQPAYSERREKRKRKLEPPGDASYAFGYETDEAARHEVADPDGNVKGWYTYVDDEGTVRKIIYTAGAGKGFVILGKEKVRGPGSSAPAQPKRHKSHKGSSGSDYGYSADTSTFSSVKHQKPPSTPSSLTNYFNNWNDLAKAGTSNPPVPTTIITTAEPSSRTKKPVFIVKIKRPVHKEQYDEDESGYDTSGSGQASASSSSSAEDSEHDESNERGGGGGGLPVKSDPDSSYVFGYETDNSNRLEKADPYGNVRGSYSYIGSSLNQLLSRHSASAPHHRRYDEPKKQKRRQPRKQSSKRSVKSVVDPDGVKRTVHYIAGGNTGFQVIHASPSISRGVRLEAPPGYVVKRVPSLRTSESRYPIPITVPQPSAIVYHIHPDSGWKPWEPTIRKKKVKIHRKKLPKAYFENAQRDGIVLLQTHPELPSTNVGSPGAINVGSSSTNTYFKEKITSGRTGTVTAKETQYPSFLSVPVSKRRHAPQRGYTAEHHLVQIEDEDSKEHVHTRAYLSPQKSAKSSSPSSAASASISGPSLKSEPTQAVHEREPLLYSPTFETVRDASRMPIPNPIQLQPTQVAVKNRGAPTQPATGAQPGLDTSSSNNHPVAFTSDGKLQVDVPTVVIEAIEANSQSSLMTVKKDENKNAAPITIIHRLPEAAALTQNPPPSQQQQLPSKSSVNTNTRNTIIHVVPTIRPNYEISSASASSAAYKYHHHQNHHHQPNAASAPTPPPIPVESSPLPVPIQKQQSPQPVANQLQPGGNVPSSPTAPPSSRSRRRHHRSKTTTTSPPAAPTANSASNSSNAIKAGIVSSGNAETTTMMSSSKRLINRLAATDQDVAVVA